MSRNAPRGTSQHELLGLESGLEALQASPEFRGPVESLDGHHCNDHFALIYKSREEQFTAAVPFMRQGLERGERCMYVVDEHSRSEILAALEDAGVDVDEALESGALTFHTIEETYLRDGTFDPDGMIGFYAAAIEKATEEFEALRVTAGTTWLQDEGVALEDFMEYESKVNDLFAEEDCIALCQYDRNGFPPETIRDIIQTHPHLIYDGTVCHNFYYTPPEAFFGPEQPAREVDRMIGTLLDRTRAKTALQARQEYQRELYEITASADLTFGEKAERLLELGCERFDLEIGFFSRIDGDRFEIVHAVGSHDRIQPGSVDLLSGTYCRQVLDSVEPFGVRDALAEGWEDDPACRTYGLDSFIGTTVTAGGEPCGTLCFASQSAREKPFDDAERTFLNLMGQWVSYELERQQREKQLAALNDMSRELMNAETQAEIAEVVTDHARGSLQLPVTALVSYERQQGTLSPAAQTPRAEDELPTAMLCAPESGPLWETFVANETRILDDVSTIAGAGDDLGEVLAVPLGREGLFVTATTADGSTTAGLDFVQATVATVKAAYTRAGREQLLHEREETLEEQNETLERLNRVNDIIRNIDKALVQASTRTEIETVVCKQLADVGPYELAWIGEHDPVTDEITPRRWAGTEKGYLEEITVTADDSPEGQGPGGRAVRTREPQVVNNVLDDPKFRPYRQAALNRGYHACIVLPLVYEGSLYGILTAYAGRPDVFGELEGSVLMELSDTIAYAINAVESKKALVSEAVTELKFDVHDTDVEIVELSSELDCTITLESVVSRTDGQLRLFFSVRGVRAATFADAAARIPVRNLSLISEHEEDGNPVGLFEGVPSDESFYARILEHGGVPREIVVGREEAYVLVELAADAATREFVEMFRTSHPGAELVAQRTRERTPQSPTEVYASLTDSLTDRQLEVLQTAYFSGYFEKPRTRTGSEIAASLDITQPTFNHHVRAAQRKFCRALFEDDGSLGVVDYDLD